MKISTIAILASALFVSAVFAGDIVIYPNGIVTNSIIVNSNCPGDNRWHASYAKTAATGWGWAPDTNNFSSFSATITNRTDTHISDFGFLHGHADCGVALNYSAPVSDSKFRYTVYGTNNPPNSTNQLPLVLHNFNP